MTIGGEQFMQIIVQSPSEDGDNSSKLAGVIAANIIEEISSKPITV